MAKKTVEELQKELAELRSYHSSAWDTYGSELCAGDMIAQEEKLEKEIAKQKAEEEERYIEDVSQVLDNSVVEKPEDNIGLKQLREIKEETINRWKKSGLLEGLEGSTKENIWKLFESELSYLINEAEADTKTQFSDVVFPAIRKASDCSSTNNTAEDDEHIYPKEK